MNEEKKHGLRFATLLHKLTFIASPRAVWILFIAFFLAVNLTQVLFLGHFFFLVTQGEPNAVLPPGTATESISRERLRTNIENFERRIAVFESLKTSHQPPSDPSR